MDKYPASKGIDTSNLRVASDWPTLKLSYIDIAKTPQCGFYEITPALASYILEHRNSKNRSVSATKLAQVCDDIRSARFLTNGESIIFSAEADLLDGQHRLIGCVETDTPIIALCAFGIPPEARGTIDLGRARTPGNILQINGVANGDKVGVTARNFIAYRLHNGRTLGRSFEISPPMIIEEVETNPNIIDAMKWATSHKKDLKGICSESDLATARLILEPAYGQEVVFYLERVAIGDNIKRNDPAFAVRQRLSGMRGSKQLVLEIIMRGAVAHMDGRTLSRIQTEGQLPTIKTRSAQAHRADATLKIDSPEGDE